MDKVSFRRRSAFIDGELGDAQIPDAGDGDARILQRLNQLFRSGFRLNAQREIQFIRRQSLEKCGEIVAGVSIELTAVASDRCTQFIFSETAYIAKQKMLDQMAEPG